MCIRDRYGRTGQRDFAEELGELANLVGGKKKPLSNRLGEVVPGDGSANDENPFTLKGETSHKKSSPMKVNINRLPFLGVEQEP